MKNKISLLIFLLLTNISVYSSSKEAIRFESVTLTNTQIRKLHSDANNVDYKLYVNIPASYYSNERKDYPVLFLLDADYSFALAKQISEHLIDRNKIKEVLLVGIAYDGAHKYQLNRTRDYTISNVKNEYYMNSEISKVSGGASHFKKFISKELIPYIEKSFPVNKNYSLVGHSFGGLFAASSLFDESPMFQNLIIVSPSLWYDDNKIIKMAKNKINFDQTLPLNIYFGIGSKENGGDHKMVDDQDKFCKIISNKSHANIKLHSSTLQGFDHDSVFPVALTEGLLKIYG